MGRVDIKCQNCSHTWYGKHPDDRKGYGKPVCGQCGNRAGEVISDESETGDSDPDAPDSDDPENPENREVTEITAEDLTNMDGEDNEPEDTDIPDPTEPSNTGGTAANTSGSENQVTTIAGTLTYDDGETKDVPSGLNISEIQTPKGERTSVTTTDSDVIVKADGRSFLVDESENVGYMVIQP